MGLGSNPNLQGLDQSGMFASQRDSAAELAMHSDPRLQTLSHMGTQMSQGLQLNWQQQLLQQQQLQRQMQHAEPAGMFSQGLAGGFRNHLGHALPPVPSWQGGLPGQQGGARQFSGSPDALGLPGNHQGLQAQFADGDFQVQRWPCFQIVGHACLCHSNTHMTSTLHSNAIRNALCICSASNPLVLLRHGTKESCRIEEGAVACLTKHIHPP